MIVIQLNVVIDDFYKKLKMQISILELNSIDVLYEAQSIDVLWCTFGGFWGTPYNRVTCNHKKYTDMIDFPATKTHISPLIF